MYHRILTTIISSGAIGLAGSWAAPTLHAQARFADAQSVKRAIEYRSSSVAMENR